jgi:hypothetical protein
MGIPEARFNPMARFEQILSIESIDSSTTNPFGLIYCT